uniref:ATPase provides energy for both assembly of type IV secretion complex and secretion of T-DNA complex (VirB4) n=1 Tax=Pseudomonas syringae TaxID=317 RepID=I3W2I7_PSESX|nr:ATPase provides energy for both assembly of type IV secretion complex and secretion of T-DNA complex (VirB4) [Pseudomonas syringae]AFK89814.1 ATPase provides energy for both assembly of type IV secretion complex and secretion of T-DNA complex (VirB4) [Pseudomonas syringae]
MITDFKIPQFAAAGCPVPGGEHAWLFDNESDVLDFETRDIFGFDLTDFIVAEDQPAPITRTPLLMYLLFRVRESINGKRRCMQVFDEFAQYLDDPIIDLQIKRGLKTDRKKDCIYLFATQEPNDAIESRIGKTVIQQCVTQILLENRKATAEDYIDGLKLTPTELAELWKIPMGSRQFLYKQGNQSTMAVMDLTGLDREISILSGTPDNAEILQEIIDASGSIDPVAWMPKYFDAVVGPSAMAR